MAACFPSNWRISTRGSTPSMPLRIAPAFIVREFPQGTAKHKSLPPTIFANTLAIAKSLSSFITTPARLPLAARSARAHEVSPLAKAAYHSPLSGSSLSRREEKISRPPARRNTPRTAIAIRLCPQECQMFLWIWMSRLRPIHPRAAESASFAFIASRFSRRACASARAVSVANLTAHWD